ncbi:hypothetical protein BJV78DRAFT_631047 [Lactifluus subvellereus]|nr:hypothetical protein BJV78DRAFT_631047 [Lactifluus subvellereus]
MRPQKDYLQPTEQIAPQPPHHTQAYTSQLHPTFQSQLQPPVQPMPLPFAPNPTWTSREDFSAHQDQLRQMGMAIFDLIDGHIPEGSDFFSLWQAVAQYKEKSESMVRELEWRVENPTWATGFPLNPTTPNPAVNEGATYDSGAQALSQTFEPPPNARDTVSQPVRSSTRELPRMPLEVTRARGDVARRIAHPDACPAATGEPREFTVTLMWCSDKCHTRVLVGDPIRGRLASKSKWPDHLSIKPTWRAMHQDKFQKWLREHNLKPVRLQAAPETEDCEFDRLLKWLRDNECYAVASWVIQGDDQSTTDLLLAPFGTCLLGVLFPISGMSESAKSQLQWLDPTMDLIAPSHQLQARPPIWNAAAVQHQPNAYMQGRQLPAQQNQQPTWSSGHAETIGYGDTGTNTGPLDGNGLIISGYVVGESSGSSWPSDTFWRT